MRIATFNVQNLRLRRKPEGPRLDGARDSDVPHETGPAAEALDPADRALTARLIAEANADVIALQEVFDQETLDHFHDALLAPLGARYPHRVCIEGNDGRSEDVAVLSRRPLQKVQSHAELSFADLGLVPPHGEANARVFRRDCLAVEVGSLWLFICHLKAALPADANAHAIRRAEALGVRHVIAKTLPDAADALWIALGDFNAHQAGSEADLAPLTDGFAIDLTARIPQAERWTYRHPDNGARSCPDRMFASPALAARFPDAAPRIVRHDTGPTRPRASDHALMLLDLAL